ncbi:hypothetical protein CWR43_28230 [Rhizobium sullae]|uniref:SGNH hydrolase-type esterase domain-containing protein n=1 Tax=Rhizobium sullae TaxID=50338 RepID=A0A2N0D2V3_RHISU|nr:SGNH/GDSL hydrolase family protein [Rhizobium sullae]PKA40463.1 hypothetical protein CWR43_28230 [Rhizobium sullae]
MLNNSLFSGLFRPIGEYRAHGGKGVGVGGPQIEQADFPRLAILGPSTSQRNTHARNDTPNMYGFAATGPVSWARRMGLRFDHRHLSSATSPYFTGDNYAREGAVFTTISAQCDAVVTAFAGITNKWAIIEPGRNDIQNGMSAATFMTNLQTCLDKLIAGGFTVGTNKIVIKGSWKKPSAYGGVWANGGAARATLDEVNALMAAITTTNVLFVDTQTGMADPATGSLQDPYADTTVSDFTHLTAKGAQREGAIIYTRLAPYLTSYAYPAADSGNKLPAFSGTTGTLTNGATGTALTGWDVAKEAVGNVANVVASIVTIDSKQYQRMTLTNMGAANVLSEAAQFRLASNGAVAHGLAAGTLLAMRARVKIAPTAAPVGLSARISDLGSGGKQVSAIALPYNTATSSEVTQAAAAPASATVHWLDATAGLDLWLDSPAAPLIGSSTLRPLICVRYGPSAETIVADIGEWYTYVVT